MSKIPKHIQDIYVFALTLDIPLRKMIHNGVTNVYNNTRRRAATFVSYYIISEKKNDNNR